MLLGERVAVSLRTIWNTQVLQVGKTHKLQGWSDWYIWVPLCFKVLQVGRNTTPMVHNVLTLPVAANHCCHLYIRSTRPLNSSAGSWSTFRRNLVPPSSGWKNQWTRNNVVPSSCHPDDWSAKFLRNVGSYKSHTALTSQKTPSYSHRRENLKF
jgi:hypothetical protein